MGELVLRAVLTGYGANVAEPRKEQGPKVLGFSRTRLCRLDWAMRDTTAELLTVGNETVLSMVQYGWKRLDYGELPKDSWQVGYTVGDTGLVFEILLQRDVLLRAFIGEATDSFAWTAMVAVYAAATLIRRKAALSEQGEVWPVPGSTRVAFLVKGHRTVEMTSSCTLAFLEVFAAEIKGMTFRDVQRTLFTSPDFAMAGSGKKE